MSIINVTQLTRFILAGFITGVTNHDAEPKIGTDAQMSSATMVAA